MAPRQVSVATCYEKPDFRKRPNPPDCTSTDRCWRYPAAWSLGRPDRQAQMSPHQGQSKRPDPGWRRGSATTWKIFYLSGQLAFAGRPQEADGRGQEHRGDGRHARPRRSACSSKIKALLEAQGYKMSDLVKLTLFVAADPQDRQDGFRGRQRGLQAVLRYGGKSRTPSRARPSRSPRSSALII